MMIFVPLSSYCVHHSSEIFVYELQVDGDTSTNDTVIALASGLSGAARISNFSSPEAAQLQSCLDAVCSMATILYYFMKQKNNGGQTICSQNAGCFLSAHSQ